MIIAEFIALGVLGIAFLATFVAYLIIRRRRRLMFRRISIPLIRRIYPQLIAHKIIDVQPLTEPTGLKYYLNHRYSENKGAKNGQSVSCDDSLDRRVDTCQPFPDGCFKPPTASAVRGSN